LFKAREMSNKEEIYLIGPRASFYKGYNASIPKYFEEMDSLYFDTVLKAYLISRAYELSAFKSRASIIYNVQVISRFDNNHLKAFMGWKTFFSYDIA
jgi:hypothetical protein